MVTTMAGNPRKLNAAKRVPLNDQSKAPKFSSSMNSSIGTAVAALRWGSLLVGLFFATVLAGEGEVRVVATLAIAVFLTSWRTINPIRISNAKKVSLIFALADVAILAAAIGLREGFANPFVGTVFVAVAIVAFGWGFFYGTLAAAISLVVSTLVLYVSGDLFRFPTALEILALAAIGILPGLAFDRVMQVDRSRVLLGQRDRLVETNSLLETLHGLARTLPSSLDLTEVVETTKKQIQQTFQPHRMAILIYEEEKWAPLLQDGFQIEPETSTAELPEPLVKATRSAKATLINDLSAYYDRSGSAMYVRLIANYNDVGLLAVEHYDAHHYGNADKELLEGLADVLALTLANARSFNRLRTLAAAEERTRIARDLHDRLGQYLTYIAIELERITNNEKKKNPDLKNLQDEVQATIAEFRDTLLELRTAVTSQRPLTIVLPEVIERFKKRSKLEVELHVPDDLSRLSAPVENELLRISQEALTNIEKHAAASRVYIHWKVADGKGVLAVTDDGRGFEPGKGIRGNAYGLVGMRERAAAIGALLDISSKPGQGTTITVQTKQTLD